MIVGKSQLYKWIHCRPGRGEMRCGCAAVARLRRALLLLALGASCAALMLYWCQQSDMPHLAHRALRPDSSEAGPQWTWRCREERCERELASAESSPQSLRTCNMLCADMQLWPRPTGPVSLATAVVSVAPQKFSLHILRADGPLVKEHLKGAFELMLSDLSSLDMNPRSSALSAVPVIVRVSVNGSDDPRLKLDTDESYEISLRPLKNHLEANVTARSFCGARHGFETLSQLVWYDPYASAEGGLVMMQAATVKDSPRFSYRSLMLDTARNYFPVKDILRTLDAMAMNKMNTFHWHVTDSQSFPLKLRSTVVFAENGAYAADKVYQVEDVEEIVRHARLRGIRVLMEMDAPAHVGRAWAWGPAAGLGELAYCVESAPWNMYCGEPPCGQINPKNPHVYDLLEKIYREIIEITGVDDIFHLGGDEVSENCWYQHINDTSPMELWEQFTEKAIKRLVKANKGKKPAVVLLWSSKLTTSPQLEALDENIAVQIWGGSKWSESSQAMEARRSVLAHVDAWYLDCGFGSWRDSSDGACGPYRSWQLVYDHRPWATVSQRVRDNILGGAVCMWTEQVGPESLDARVWPRAAAAAERLWSDCACEADSDVYLRMDTQRGRMVERGISASQIWPKWCSDNPTQCLE